MDADFLLTRAADLAVLGVRLQNVTFDTTVTPAVAIAGGDARVVLFLPPQHIIEQSLTGPPPDGFTAAAQLAGPSRLAFLLAPGTRLPLEAAAILRTCHRLAPAVSTAGRFDTAVEIPWHLAFSPTHSDGQGVSSLHPGDEITSPSGVTALWLSRLGIATDAQGFIIEPGDPAPPLDLIPVDGALANTADPVPDPSLTQSNRNEIVQLGSTATRAIAERLELTPIGGSLTAGRQWPGFLWSHRATLGRDQEVVVVETGICYPFGFRAEFTTTVKRGPETLGSSDSAVLRTAHSLRFLETVKKAPDPGLFSRDFPFASVEVTRPLFEDLGTLDVVYTSARPTPELNGLREELAGLQNQAANDRQIWGPVVLTPFWTLDSLAAAGDPNAQDLQAISIALNGSGDEPGINARIGTLETNKIALNNVADAIDEASRVLDRLIANGAGPEEIQAQQDAISMLQQQEREIDFNPIELANLNTQKAQLEARALVDGQAIDSLLHTPRPLADLAVEVAALGGTGSAEAQDWLDLQPRIVDTTQRIQAQEAVAVTTDIAGWPRDPAGQKLAFPMMLRTRSQLQHVSMPLIFVKDIVLPAVDTVPEYASLSDPLLPSPLDTSWIAAKAGVIALEGAALDIVGSASPKPEDTHEVHALNILGALGSDPFTPVLGRPQAVDQQLQWAMQVALPALRALGSEVPAHVPSLDPLHPPDTFPDLHVGPGLPLLPGMPVVFDNTYLQIGEQAPALLKPLADIAVDFTGHADRSGGLAALQLKADAISRELGPVQLAGLTTPDPKALIGPTATLLGFKLQDLLRKVSEFPVGITPPDPPKPPKIISDLIDGKQPEVRMEWNDIVLHDFLALRTYPTDEAPGRKSTLDIIVVSSLDSVSTTCTLTDFALVFPPTGTGLLKLDISALKFSQETTHQQARPPHLDFPAPGITFLGPLTFIEKLQKAVHLIGSVANVQAKPSGIVASFTLPVPPVSCGVFNLSNVTFRSGVEVPFGGDPVVVSIAFASRLSPFNLSVNGLGGGGYVEIRIEEKGSRIEASLEFGALVAIDFIVASGEVHVFGGVRYLQDGDQITLTGYIRIGGTVNVLGLISASIELVVQLGYDLTTNVLSGRATLVLELDLTLWSDSVEIDSGEWTFKGGLDDIAFEALPASDGLAAWRRYRSAFTGVTA